MFSQEQKDEARECAVMRRGTARAMGHQRKDGTEGSLETDYLAALAEVYARDFIFNLPKDQHPLTFNDLGPDFILPDGRAIHVKHTLKDYGSMLLRDRDRPNIRTPEDVFVLVIGDEDEMRFAGFIYGDEFDAKILYRWRWEQDADGKVHYLKQNRLRDPKSMVHTLDA